MKSINRKYPAINLLEIYCKLSIPEWNNWLYNCLRSNDVEKLKRTRYGIQAGTSDLARQKLMTPQLTVLFLRLQKSLEDTARKIYRKLYPNPLDKTIKGKRKPLEFKDAKRKRDAAFKAWLKESAF